MAATVCASKLFGWEIFLSYTSSKKNSTLVYCDNNSTIKLFKNPVLHGRSKHIDVKYYFLRNLTKDGADMVYCKSEDQITNILTKPLKFLAFQNLRNYLESALCKIVYEEWCLIVDM